MVKTENYIRELYFIVFAQRQIIIWTTILFFVVAVLIAFLWPPVYSASGSVLLKGRKTEKSPEAIESVELRPSGLRKEDLASEIEIIMSPDVIERTIKSLQDKNLFDKNVSMTNEVYKIQQSVKSAMIPASNVIEISFFSRNKKDAVNILNALMEQYIAFRLSVYSPSQAESFYSQQADKYRSDLDKRETELLGIISNTRVADPQKELDNNLFLKQRLEEQLAILKSDLIDRKITVKHLDNVLKDKNLHQFSFLNNLPLNELAKKLQDLYIERGKLLRSYNEASDKIKLIDKQIFDLYNLLRSEVRAYNDDVVRQVSIAGDKIGNIENKIKNIDAQSLELKKQLLEQQRIEREARLSQYSYETFVKRREEAKSDRTGIATNIATISVLSKAFPSDGPVFPKKGVVIPLGLLAGFITGCSLGFLREFFDHTFKKPSDAINYTGLQVIFSIPDMGGIRPLFSFRNVKFKFRLFSLLLLLAAAFVTGGLLKDMPSIKEMAYLVADRMTVRDREGSSHEPLRNIDSNDAYREGYKQRNREITDSDDNNRVVEKKTGELVAEPEAEKDSKYGRLAATDEGRKILNENLDKDQSALIGSIKKSILLYDEKEGYYFLLVNVFKQRRSAYEESEKLLSIGLKSFVSAETLSDKGAVYRVLLGPFMRKSDALKIKSGWQVVALSE